MNQPTLRFSLGSPAGPRSGNGVKRMRYRQPRHAGNAFTEFATARQGSTSLRYRLIRETKSDLDDNLKFRLTIMDCPADLLNLKPVKIAQSLTRLGDCVADSLLNAIAGNAGHLNYFVGLFWHWSLRAEADY